jgi:hypothetical protein
VPADSLPPRVLSAVERLARRLGREARRTRHDPLKVVVVGPATPRVLAVVGRALSDSPELRDGPAAGDAADVVVALDWVRRQPDPDQALAALRDSGAAHVLLAAPSRPLAALARRPGAWTGSGFLRAASRVGGVREVAHVPGWTVVWARHN